MHLTIRLIGAYLEGEEASCIFMTGGGLLTGAKRPQKSGSSSPTKAGNQNKSYLLECLYFRDGSQILEKTVLGGRRFTSKEQRKYL